jgi:hypothetical protein
MAENQFARQKKAEHQSPAVASQEALMRIFTIPEDLNSILGKNEQHLSQNLNGFLNVHIAAVEKPLREIEKDFSQSKIPEQPTHVSDHAQELLISFD